MRHVVWIGGGTGAGKTTAAWTLAVRHGLRSFHVDAFWYAHDARLGEPPLSPDERWLVPAFACECGRRGCAARVELGLDEFARRSAVRAAGH